MARFIRGEVVVFPFPFSDLSASKRRPALVIAPLHGDDLILCQITSQNVKSDQYSVGISSSDFVSGGLSVDSYARPNRLFTGDSSIVIKSAGLLSEGKLIEIINVLIDIIKPS
jgi:mRNA interferase MazF